MSYEMYDQELCFHQKAIQTEFDEFFFFKFSANTSI